MVIKGIFLVAQQVKDLASSLQELGSLLWHRFDPWLRNLHVSQVHPPKSSYKNRKITSLKINKKYYEPIGK